MQRQYVNLALTALVAFGGLVVTLLVAKLCEFRNVFLTALFFSGSVGAVVNNYFRLSKISANPASVETELRQPAVSIQIWVSLFLSGILGFVAYGLFLSGLLQGELFPKFNELDSAYASFGDLLDDVSPKTNLDASKALLWAFVAGFSERFIPNILDSLVLKAEADTNSG
jgi:hypothetical protein